MRKENLFSIGDVARLFHISVGTLRHYESLGLVVPEAIDPDTGYRYYSVRQFEPLNTIRYLRALDMPLPKIAEFLSDRDVPRIERMLLFQKQQIAQKRRELELIDRKIDNRLRQLHDAQHCTLEEIALVQTRELRVALLEGALPVRSSGDLELPIRRLEPQKQKSAVFLGKVGVGLSREHLLGGEFFPYDVVFLALDDEDETPPEFQRLPAALCARIHFCGRPHAGPLALSKADGLFGGKRPRTRRLLPRDHAHRRRRDERPLPLRHADRSAGEKNKDLRNRAAKKAAAFL